MKKVKSSGHVWVAIIAGGQGTRLFPLSHEGCPKQFCPINKTQTFIQATIKRFVDFGIKRHRVVIIVTNDNQLELARAQCLPLGVISENILKISPDFGYAGAMLEAAEFISRLDEEAVIINTPADQHIIPDESFMTSINRALDSARAGNPTIIGVKINDLVTFMGCGHALYDAPGDDEEEKPTYDVTGFVEKPNEELAVELMRGDGTVCNTGINVWDVQTILRVNTNRTALSTDNLMCEIQRISSLRITIGTFPWYDCGTLKSLYDISLKTPNHKNASIGQGLVERTDCLRSLFYTPDGVTLRATGIEDCAVVVNIVDDKIFVAVVKLSDSQDVKLLAEEYYRSEHHLASSVFSVSCDRAHNNLIMRTNCSEEVYAGFVGTVGYAIYSHKASDGGIEIAVSKQWL